MATTDWDDYAENACAILSGIPKVASLSLAPEVVMAPASPSKAQLTLILPSHRLSHSRSQSQLQSNVHSQLGPWAQWGHTSASLNGLETLKRPKLTHSATMGNEHLLNTDSSPAAPSVLTRPQGRGSRRLDGRLNEYGDPVPKPSMDHFGSKSYDDNMTKRYEPMQRVSRTHSSPETRTLPPPPEPPMTKSATKVMQRTGYDPTMEIREGKNRQSSLNIVTDNSDSSGSTYSQEDEISSPMAQYSQHVGSAPVSPMRQDEIGRRSRINSSNVSTHESSTPKSLVISPEYNERVSRFMQGNVGEPNGNGGPPYSASLEDLIDQERLRHEYQCRSDNATGYCLLEDEVALMPQPLVVPTKKNRQSYFSESPETPIAPVLPGSDQHSMRKSSAVSFMPHMTSRDLGKYQSQKTREGGSSSGKHPLKSPFPFLSTLKASESPKATSSTVSLSGKFSGALKRLSLTKTSPIDRDEVIPNARRSPTGPDTPMPKKSGFMGIKGAPDVIQKGNEHFHGVVEKARLSISKKERRRKQLKKQIVVVGIMDQTPGQLRTSLLWFLYTKIQY